jgi:hypothetical protein
VSLSCRCKNETLENKPYTFVQIRNVNNFQKFQDRVLKYASAYEVDDTVAPLILLWNEPIYYQTVTRAESGIFRVWPCFEGQPVSPMFSRPTNFQLQMNCRFRRMGCRWHLILKTLTAGNVVDPHTP